MELFLGWPFDLSVCIFVCVIMCVHACFPVMYDLHKQQQ